MVNRVSLFVFLLAWIWQHGCARVLLEWDSPELPPGAGMGCVLLMGLPWACKVPSHLCFSLREKPAKSKEERE